MNQQHITSGQLVDYLYGELAPSQDAWVHGHLAECPTCADDYDREVSLTAQLRDMARAQERDLPQRYVNEIFRAATQRRTTPWASPSFFIRPLVAAPLALVIGAIVYAGAVTHWGVTGLHRIDALSYVHDHTAVTAAAPFSDDTPIPAVLAAEATRPDMSADASP